MRNRLQTLKPKEIQDAVSSSRNLTAAARRLGVDRSTLHRWIQGGKVQRRTVKRPRASTASGSGSGVALSPNGWARRVRRMYDLSANELVLVDLGRRMLIIARNSPKEEVRIAATGRWQAINRQLNLEDEADGQAEETRPASIRPFPRRVG